MNCSSPNRLCRASWSGIAALAIGAAAPAWAQAPSDPTDLPRPVEQGVEDVDPLRTSLRVPLSRDLRLPTGWESVYPVRYRDASGQVREGFARASGGLVAVFPWSVYVPSRHGTIIDVPPGTVFHLGSIEDVSAELERAPDPPEGSRPDTSPDTAAVVAPAAAGPSLDARAALNAPYRSPAMPALVPPSVWTDEGYRRQRMSGMLARAAAAGSEP